MVEHKYDDLKYGISAIVPEQLCTGCSACMNVCPKSAISMRENAIGHILPYINKTNCIDCGLCRATCPSMVSVKKRHPQQTFASWAKNTEEHNTSTSGGIAAVIARNITQRGGVVYGCASLPRGIIKHIRIDRDDEVYLLKGSKYVQSEIGFSYVSAKNDLSEGREVAFFGMPCQIAGLKSFLRCDYPNLYAVDLICHGVPPQKMLFEHIDSIGIKRETIDGIKFRDGSDYRLQIASKGSIVYSEDDLTDTYLSAFNDSLLVRESCVNCQYSTNERCGDLTIGDFRRLGISVPFNEKREECASVMLVNTVKGEELLNICSKDLVLYKRDFQEADNGNPHLHMPTRRKGNYDRFRHDYLNGGYVKAINKALRIRKIKNFILNVLNLIK